MSNPRPESRIKSLETRATTIEARIEEMASDSAEEFKAVRQDIKQLNDGIMDSFKELGNYFELTEKAMATKDDISRLEIAMATKDDITSVKNDISTLDIRLSKIEDTQEQILKLLQQKLGE